jgi:DNA (cytosine-5)-methyltransferase 1
MLPTIDIITGGFPCQDISVAGAGKGLEGERSKLFFEIIRLVDECKPTWIFLENVPAIRTRGGETVGKELASRGYDCRWETLSAAEVGANHTRNRWFLLAHSHSLSVREQSRWISRKKWAHATKFILNGEERNALDAYGERCAIAEESDAWLWLQSKRERADPTFAGASWWNPEPGICRVDDGVPLRVDRLRGLGNAVVPAQAREAFERLVGLK